VSQSRSSRKTRMKFCFWSGDGAAALTEFSLYSDFYIQSWLKTWTLTPFSRPFPPPMHLNHPSSGAPGRWKSDHLTRRVCNSRQTQTTPVAVPATLEQSHAWAFCSRRSRAVPTRYATVWRRSDIGFTSPWLVLRYGILSSPRC